MEQSTATVTDGELAELLARGVELEASDLHLAVGHRPTFRIHGALNETDAPVVTTEQAERIIPSVMPEGMREKLGRQYDFDFSLTFEHAGAPHRFRVNVFRHQSSLGACFRYVPDEIPSFAWMGFPERLAERISAMPGGLVLITGVTGSGKTTTLAALVELMNRAGGRRIITIEQPIEYIFAARPNSFVTQREVGVDVPTFADGLKYGLRQDPDVILAGEVRDTDTARMVISAAETGHLVLTTVHTRDARGAITRLVDIFPASRQDDIRAQLSLSLQCVISQHLLPHVEPGHKRVLATEVLMANDPLRAAIRQNRIESIDTVIQTGKRYGMQPLDDDLARLMREGQITPAVARRVAKNPDGLGA